MKNSYTKDAAKQFALWKEKLDLQAQTHKEEVDKLIEKLEASEKAGEKSLQEVSSHVKITQ
jgi:hypothetical protein